MTRIFKTVSPVVLVLLIALVICGIEPVIPNRASAAELGNRSLEMSSSTAGKQGVTYNISFQITTPGNLGSVEFEFCSNSTFPTDICVAPTGLDTSHAVFTMESGISGFTIYSEGANYVTIARPATPTLAVNANAIFDNITNPSQTGSYYLRVLTYPTDDGSGAYTDNGGMAFAINANVNVNVKVPPYLLFCTGNTITGTDCSTTTGDFIELGALTTTHTSSGQSQMVIATNAQSGYNISVNGATLTSGNNTIAPLTAASPPQIGISQFGINLRANATPAVGSNPTGPGSGAPTVSYDQPNLYTYNNGDIVATTNGVEDYRKFTVSYIVNISKQQPAGIYASTFTFVALANF